MTGKGGWLESTRHRRARRALERQLAYQTNKAAGYRGHEAELVHNNFAHAQAVRSRIEAVRGLQATDRILEVGSGAHGIVFGLGAGSAVGVDPLAVHYRRLFPGIQAGSTTVAAIGERLPFGDASFDVVLSDNVIDHAEGPFEILTEMVRVLRPAGLLYFTVNVHHPVYNLASRLHGAWNAVGLRFELSAFADHTVHLTERRISAAFRQLPLKVVEQGSTIAATRSLQRSAGRSGADALLKRLFFKNAVFELIAVRR